MKHRRRKNAKAIDRTAITVVNRANTNEKAYVEIWPCRACALTFLVSASQTNADVGIGRLDSLLTKVSLNPCITAGVMAGIAHAEIWPRHREIVGGRREGGYSGTAMEAGDVDLAEDALKIE